MTSRMWKPVLFEKLMSKFGFTFQWKLLLEKEVFVQPRQWNYPMNLTLLVCLFVRSCVRLQLSKSEMTH